MVAGSGLDRSGWCHRPVGHEPLEGADRHRGAFLGPDAASLALDLLGADPPCDTGERVVVEQRRRRAVHVPDAEPLDEERDVDPDGAAVDADGVLALEAAFRLEHRELLRIA